MRLLGVAAEGFRNLREVRLSFGSPVTVFCGANAQGKTSLLEAVYLLGTTKSFRENRLEPLIRFGASEARLEGEVRSGGVAHRLQGTLHRKGKRFLLDGREVPLAEYLTVLPVVVHCAEDRGIVKGEPRSRRSLLDAAGILRKPAYLRTVLEFGKVRAQRGALLRSPRCRPQELAAWTGPYAELGERVQRERQEVVETLNGLLSEMAAELGTGERLRLVYHPSGGGDLPLALERLRENEMKVGTNLAGPQRDRVDFLLDGRALEAYGSSGQARTALWMVKLALVLLGSRREEDPPLFLVDDAEAELDERRIGDLLRLTGRRAQVILTTTREGLLFGGEAEVRRVAEGRVA
ncbi:MAG: DNA replication/repair protein RecF [Acidobacteriota bacterium]